MGEELSSSWDLYSSASPSDSVHIATCSSLQHFLHIYSYISKPLSLKPGYTLCVYCASMESSPNGCSLVLRFHPCCPMVDYYWDTLVTSLILDQFDDEVPIHHQVSTTSSPRINCMGRQVVGLQVSRKLNVPELTLTLLLNSSEQFVIKAISNFVHFKIKNLLKDRAKFVLPPVETIFHQDLLDSTEKG
ncbi:hypothetical protein P9112_001746 [Eukaryota sp. TZLM1-RC]